MMQESREATQEFLSLILREARVLKRITSWQTWGWYWSFMARQFRTNPTGRIATYDAAKFQFDCPD